MVFCINENNFNFFQPLYTCAAIMCAAKLSNTKVDVAKLVQLARSKKKELQGVCVQHGTYAASLAAGVLCLKSVWAPNSSFAEPDPEGPELLALTGNNFWVRIRLQVVPRNSLKFSKNEGNKVEY